MNEHQEQVAVCEYLNLLGQKYTAIVNGFFGNKNFGMVAKFKREGWNKGLPDLFIILKKGNNTQPIFIEMKTKDRKPKRKGKGGISDEQKEWINALNETCIKAFVCYGFDEAKLVIDNELKQL
jgi:hypothetical protein